MALQRVAAARKSGLPGTLSRSPSDVTLPPRTGREATNGNLAFASYCITLQLKWESIILLLPPTTYEAYPVATLLHDLCAIYAAPPTPPYYAIHVTILVTDRVKAKRKRGRLGAAPQA